MRKLFMLGTALCCAALLMTGCKSSESAYKKAYEKAKAQEQAEGYGTANDAEVAPTETAPVTTAPTTTTTTPVVEDYSNEPTKSENVSVVNGAGLKAFSVVVGSFSVRANAEGLQEQLKRAGYDAQVAYNAGNSMYRVVAGTFADKGSAVQLRNAMRSQYNGAWLLAK